MKNNTFYFSHDFNAHNDVKILFLRQQLGMEGYGIYWFLIESLADAGGILPLKIVPVLSMQMHTNEVKVSAVINEFGLFSVVDDQFFSARLNEHLNKVNNIKLINSEKGKRSAEARRLASVKQQLNSGSTADEQRKGKEIKEKKNKEKEIKENGSELTIADSNLFRKPNIPTFEEVKEKFIIQGGTEIMAQGFFNKWDGLGWYCNGTPIKNWISFAKNYIATYHKNEEERKQKNNQTFDPTKVKIILK